MKLPDDSLPFLEAWSLVRRHLNGPGRPLSDHLDTVTAAIAQERVKAWVFERGRGYYGSRFAPSREWRTTRPEEWDTGRPMLAIGSAEGRYRPENVRVSRSHLVREWPGIFEAGASVEDRHVEESASARPEGRSTRRHGGRDYREADAALVEEMRGLLAQGQASGAWDAALAVAGRAEGGGTEQSKAKRLLMRFQEQESLSRFQS